MILGWFEELKFIKKIVTHEMLRKIEPVMPDELREASAHLIKGGGKRLRPFLLIEVGRSLGAEIETLLPGALAVEFIHTFSLVHDDIMDNDAFRRGVRTVHTVWGIPLGILAGDILYALAFTSLAELHKRGVSSDRIRKAYQILSWSTYMLAMGQGLDMSFPGKDNVGIKDYLRMVSYKTAALFRCSTQLGAILGGGNSKIIRKMGSFGYNLGIAFQIIDDILGVFGDEKKTGKPVGSDLREGKKTILVIKGLREADQRQRKAILNVLGRNDVTQDEVLRAVEILRILKVDSYARNLAIRYSKKALAHLSALPRNVYRLNIEAAVDFVINRSY